MTNDTTLQEPIELEFAEYNMEELTDHLHIHTYELKGTEADGWEIWQCSCGMGYGKPPVL